MSIAEQVRPNLGLTGSAPLAGMRVVELSSFVASPLGGMTLAQLGADVVRVDPIGGGPDRQRWPIAPTGESLYWAGLNKGKRSVTVDLRCAEGRDLVSALMTSPGEQSGIVLTNARPRPGLDYADLCRLREDIIHARLLGTRDGGTAVDYTVNAECGFPYLTGPAGTAGPVNQVLPAWDVATGLYLAVGLLAAERHRARTGEGRRIEVSLADVALATAGNLGYLGEAELSSQSRARIGNQVYGDFGRDFRTADGQHVMVVVLTARHWNDLVAATGMRDRMKALEHALGAEFTGAEDRYRHHEVLGGILATWFESRTCAEVDSALRGRSVLWSRYKTMAEAATDAGSRPLLNRIDQPGIGSYHAPGSPLTFDGRQYPAEPAPGLGQHTDEVLGEMLGIRSGRLAELRERYVIGGAGT